MKLVRCEVPWHNFPAAFATVTRTSLEDVLHHCGHDGSQIAWPHLGEPEQRVGFHTQELIDYSLSIGYWVTAISRIFLSGRGVNEEVVGYGDDYLERRFNKYLRNYYGVLALEAGIVVWDGEKLLLPWSGEVIEYTGDHTVEVFFAVGLIQ